MQPLKQALNLLRTETRLALLLGSISLLTALLSLQMAVFGAVLISVVLLFSPLYIWNWQARGQRGLSFKLIKENATALAVLSVLTFPTGLLLGSSAGILQRTDQLLASLPQAYFLIFICLVFYAIIGQSLIFIARDNLTIAKALDLALKGLSQQILPLITMCLIIALFFIPSLFLAGLGLLLVCPVYYFSIYYFSKSVT